MYDFAHCLSDYLEGITHSLCTLEFDNNRELYDWFLDQLAVEHHPQQIEFARLNLTHTIMSKRKLRTLVEEKYVEGWDDPRMPTIAGFRQRGYTPTSIHKFIEKVGIAKSDSVVDYALLEHCIREELNSTAQRVMAVLNPLKIVLTNYPDNEEEFLPAINNPENETAGTRNVPFSKELFIEKDDFMEEPTKKFFRLAPGREVRLRYAYFIKCEKIVKDEKTGEIIELHCTYDPKTKGGAAPDKRNCKATMHWVSAKHALTGTVKLYEQLFTDPNPSGAHEKDFRKLINKNSLTSLTDCKLEPSLKNAEKGQRFQFERLGYFYVNPQNTESGKPVFHRIVTLKDTWAKIQAKK